jgi:hypothetical protein
MFRDNKAYYPYYRSYNIKNKKNNQQKTQKILIDIKILFNP